jgi:hypothetical protein
MIADACVLVVGVKFGSLVHLSSSRWSPDNVHARPERLVYLGTCSSSMCSSIYTDGQVRWELYRSQTRSTYFSVYISIPLALSISLSPSPSRLVSTLREPLNMIRCCSILSLVSFKAKLHLRDIQETRFSWIIQEKSWIDHANSEACSNIGITMGDYSNVRSHFKQHNGFIS